MHSNTATQNDFPSHHLTANATAAKPQTTVADAADMLIDDDRVDSKTRISTSMPKTDANQSSELQLPSPARSPDDTFANSQELPTSFYGTNNRGRRAASSSRSHSQRAESNGIKTEEPDSSMGTPGGYSTLARMAQR